MIEILHVGVPVDSVDGHGLTAIWWAAVSNRTDVTRVLLQRGADVDKQGGYHNRTALHSAAYKNYIDVIELLLKHGAFADIKDRSDHTPIDDARDRNNGAAVQLLERF